MTNEFSTGPTYMPIYVYDCKVKGRLSLIGTLSKIFSIFYFDASPNQLMEANQLWAQSTVKSLAIALSSEQREPQPYGWGQLSPQIHWVYEWAQNQIRTNLT